MPRTFSNCKLSFVSVDSSSHFSPSLFFHHFSFNANSTPLSLKSNMATLMFIRYGAPFWRIENHQISNCNFPVENPQLNKNKTYNIFMNSELFGRRKGKWEADKNKGACTYFYSTNPLAPQSHNVFRRTCLPQHVNHNHYLYCILNLWFP